jgi:hypothetical protein
MQNPYFVTFGFKVFTYVPELWKACESGNILSNNPRGAGFPNESIVLWPQPTLILTAELFSGKADGLTGESSGQDSRRAAAGFEDIPPPDFSDVSEELCIRESEVEEGLAKGSTSTWAQVWKPAASAAKSIPPMPVNKEA